MDTYIIKISAVHIALLMTIATVIGFLIGASFASALYKKGSK